MSRPPVAVVCALDWELAHLRRVLAESPVAWPVELVVCGAGMVNAAAATRQLVESARPRAVVNYGCAGAHRRELVFGDIVVGTKVVAYDVDGKPVVECDPELVGIARKLSVGERVVFGTVASADAWNRTSDAIGALVNEHDSLCEDMEAAAIGLECSARAVPFLTIKDIANNELLNPTTTWAALVAEVGVDQMARRAAEFTVRVVRELMASQAYSMSRC